MEEKNVMVCVTQQKTCEKLIKVGSEMCNTPDDKLYVVHVAPNGWKILGNSKEGEALDYLFEISKNVGADMTVIRSSEVVKSIIDFCKKNDINAIVLGESREEQSKNNISIELSKKLNNRLDLKIIST
ncbi:universal stress protein UspA [Serpentinicella sp. ANB-PHB4]|uniref:universal stress protein UspA n=1 Tax=Serpentinicella sp. ANB-PHB4 TaxID=3074076 RepID=UPI00285F45FE|nr:universal stress protein UspA [Serpentinicella sp. ANB-PHB4]MDR5658531.1 universal stress protein UspA [Serpentinicella sp. ANB-PHB4]